MVNHLNSYMYAVLCISVDSEVFHMQIYAIIMREETSMLLGILQISLKVTSKSMQCYYAAVLYAALVQIYFLQHDLFLLKYNFF